MWTQHHKQSLRAPGGDHPPVLPGLQGPHQIHHPPSPALCMWRQQRMTVCVSSLPIPDVFICMADAHELHACHHRHMMPVCAPHCIRAVGCSGAKHSATTLPAAAHVPAARTRTWDSCTLHAPGHPARAKRYSIMGLNSSGTQRAMPICSMQHGAASGGAP